VEVPFAVYDGDGGIGGIMLCRNFADVEVTMISTCEMPTPNSQVYQYGVVQDPVSKIISVSYDQNNILRAANSTATFSVTWPTGGLRKLDEDQQDGEVLLTEEVGRHLDAWNASVQDVSLFVHEKIKFLNKELTRSVENVHKSLDEEIINLERRVDMIGVNVDKIRQEIDAKVEDMMNSVDAKTKFMKRKMNRKVADFSAKAQEMLERIAIESRSKYADQLYAPLSLNRVFFLIICAILISIGNVVLLKYLKD